MAMAAFTKANAIVPTGGICPTSVHATIVQMCNDATLTAATAAELISPMTFAGAGARWVKVGPGGGRAEFRAVYHVSTDMTTPPIIYVIGVNAPQGTTDPAPQFPNDGTVPFERLDAASGLAGITLTRVAASDQKSTANRYTPWYSYTHPTTGVVGDLNACNWVLVLCSQAAIGGTCTIEMKLLN